MIHLTIFNLLFITSSIQAAIQSVLIAIKKGCHLHRILLIVILGILAVDSFVSFIWDASLFRLVPYMTYLNFSFALGLGPSIYFYTRSLIQPDFVFKPVYCLHYTVILIDMLNYQSGFGFNPILWDGLTLGRAMNNIGDVLLVISVFGYLFFFMAFIRKYKKSMSYIHPASIKLLTVLFIAIGLITAIWAVYLLIFHLLPVAHGIAHAIYTLIHLLMAVLLYWLGIKGLALLKPSQPSIKDHELGAQCFKIAALFDKDKIHLDPDLSLNALAAKATIPPKQLSYVLNRHFGKSYTDLINDYRVADVKDKLAAGLHSNLTIMGIAYDCGFQIGQVTEQFNLHKERLMNNTDMH